jgi:peroxiredoxin family protein
VKKAKKTGIKIIACETAMGNVGLTKDKIENGLVDEFAPVGGLYVLQKVKEGYETFWI